MIVFIMEPLDTRDHVPSKCLLENLLPDNLPVVGWAVISS